MSTQKCYTFASLYYPENMPEDWRKRIEQTHIPCCVSPFHQPDPDPICDGEKKAHYHIVMYFGKQTSLQQAREVFEYVGASSKWIEIVRSTQGYSRYICHLDHPDKEQFSINQVMEFNGAEYAKYIDDDETFLKNLEEITDYVLANQITSFHKLAAYARYNNREWFRILSMRSTLYFRTLINSIVEEQKEKEKKSNG